MAIAKVLPVSCLLALCAVTAACNGGASTPASTAAATAPAPSAAATAATPPAPTQATPARATAAPSPTPGATPAMRPSYDACISAAAGATPAMQDCMDSEYHYQDGRLNDAYKAAMAKLDETQKNALRDQQRKWVADRDEKCFYDPDSGQAGRLDAAECRLEMTTKRADELAGH